MNMTELVQEQFRVPRGVGREPHRAPQRDRGDRGRAEPPAAGARRNPTAPPPHGPQLREALCQTVRKVDWLADIWDHAGNSKRARSLRAQAAKLRRP